MYSGMAMVESSSFSGKQKSKNEQEYAENKQKRFERAWAAKKEVATWIP